MKYISRAIHWASGEFFLSSQPNGGTVILLRTLFVTTWIFFSAIYFREWILPDRNREFDFFRLRVLVAESIPAYGAIFATTYALFYTRFSSQWTYLAQLYNQLMATSARIYHSNKDSVDRLARWQAAFIEDAEDLHLALKPMFASAILQMIDDDLTRRYFVSGTTNGKKRIEELKKKLEKPVGQES